MEKDRYLYNEEKDKELERLSEQIATIPDMEGKVEFFKTLPRETTYELLSFSRWENVKEQLKKEELERERKELQRQNQALRRQNKEEKDIIEMLSYSLSFGEA